jgi:hypothetical protein
MPCHQNHNFLINKSSENVANSNILENDSNKNCINEEIKGRLDLWNACYHSVQNLVFPSAL